MRELAVQYGVPFDFIDDRESTTAIPAELQKIASNLLAYAQGSRYGWTKRTSACSGHAISTFQLTGHPAVVC